MGVARDVVISLEHLEPLLQTLQNLKQTEYTKNMRLWEKVSKISNAPFLTSFWHLSLQSLSWYNTSTKNEHKYATMTSDHRRQSLRHKRVVWVSSSFSSYVELTVQVNRQSQRTEMSNNWTCQRRNRFTRLRLQRLSAQLSTDTQRHHNSTTLTSNLRSDGAFILTNLQLRLFHSAAATPISWHCDSVSTLSDD